jgi:lipopolysaccharide export system protein LptC
MWERWVGRGLLILSVVLAAFLGYLLYTRSDSFSPPRPVPAGGAQEADARIEGFTFTQTKGDIVQWKVEAQRAHLYEDDKRAVLSDVQITLYGVQGKELMLTGEEGTLETDTKNFMLANRNDPITIQMESGYVIRTNHLNWIDKRREIQTSDPVAIDGHGLQITGRGLLGKLDSEIFQVLDDVHVDVASSS